MANRDKPQILLISLEHMDYFDKSYEPLLSKLQSVAHVRRVKTAESALTQLATPLHAVLLTDAALSQPEQSHVWDAVLAYVRGGGTALIGWHFPSFAIPGDMQPFFEKAGLSWEAGDYTRTTVALNRAGIPGEHVPPETSESLTPFFTQKALFVKNVPAEEAWYVTSDGSVVESNVFPATSAKKPGQSPAAMAKVGEGRLGYLGDVNAENGTNAVALAMCGL